MRTTLNWTTGYEVAAYARRNENGTAVARAKHVAMFVGAPLLGLVAVIALPFAGLAAFFWMAIRAMPNRVKDVLLFLAAPFIGLTYAMALPLIGVGMLAWAGVQAAGGK